MSTEKKLEGAALEAVVDRVLKNTGGIGSTVLLLGVMTFAGRGKQAPTPEEHDEYVDASIQSWLDKGNTEQAILFGLNELMFYQCCTSPYKNPDKARKLARRVCELDAKFAEEQANGKLLDYGFYAIVGLLLLIGLIIWWIVA